MSFWKRWISRKDPDEVLLHELIKGYLRVIFLHAHIHSDIDGPIALKDRISIKVNFFDCLTFYILRDNTVLTCFNHSPGMTIMPDKTWILSDNGDFEKVTDLKKFDTVKTCFQISDPIIKSVIEAKSQTIELSQQSTISNETIESAVSLAHISMLNLIGRV